MSPAPSAGGGRGPSGASTEAAEGFECARKAPPATQTSRVWFNFTQCTALAPAATPHAPNLHAPPSSALAGGASAAFGGLGCSSAPFGGEPFLRVYGESPAGGRFLFEGGQRLRRDSLVLNHPHKTASQIDIVFFKARAPTRGRTAKGLGGGGFDLRVDAAALARRRSLALWRFVALAQAQGEVPIPERAVIVSLRASGHDAARPRQGAPGLQLQLRRRRRPLRCVSPQPQQTCARATVTPLWTPPILSPVPGDRHFSSASPIDHHTHIKRNVYPNASRPALEQRTKLLHTLMLPPPKSDALTTPAPIGTQSSFLTKCSQCR